PTGEGKLPRDSFLVPLRARMLASAHSFRENGARLLRLLGFAEGAIDYSLCAEVAFKIARNCFNNQIANYTRFAHRRCARVWARYDRSGAANQSCRSQG